MLKCQRNLFSIPEDVIYLNSAYMTPMLKSVEDAGYQGLLKKRNPGTIFAPDFFEPVQEIRKLYSKLINNPEPDRVVIIPSASYGLSSAAQNIEIRSDQKILVVDEQFPSNIYPWKRLASQSGAKIEVILPPDSTESRAVIWNDRILEAIEEDVKVVAMPIIHWTDGTLFNMEAIRNKARRVGALLIIDGTQSIGAIPFDLQQIQPDALVCATYKSLMGPYSFGLGYFGEYFDAGIPIEENWINRKDSEDFASLVNYQEQYGPLARRYEVGENANFVFIPMLKAALQQLMEWTPVGVQSYCKQIVNESLSKLDHRFWVESDDLRASNLFGVRLPAGINIHQLKEELVKNKIFVSIRGNALRISPQVYNTSEDLVKLFKFLNSK